MSSSSARTIGALEELDDEIRAGGGKATLLQLDLKAQTRSTQLGPTLYQRWGKLDIFVGNAGILGPLSPLHHVTADAWNEVIDINLTANWRLIRTLDPLLKRAEAGRAIFVTSGAATGKYAYWGPYAVSKAGLDALVKTYAHELAEHAACASTSSIPAPCAPRMRAKAFPGRGPRHAAGSRPRWCRSFLELVSPDVRLTPAASSTSADWQKKHARASTTPEAYQSKLDDHAVVGGLDAGRQLAPQRLVVEIDGHVRQDGALGRRAARSIRSACLTLKWLGCGGEAQRVDDPHVEPLQQRQRRHRECR